MSLSRPRFASTLAMTLTLFSLCLPGVAEPSTLPPNTRSWECVPSVVLADGVDAFRLEVNVNGPVTGVTLERPALEYVVPPEPWPLTLRDDGQGQDRVAGDFVFTAGPFRFKTDSLFPLPPCYNQGLNYCLPDGPEGVTVFDAGIVKVQEPGGAVTEFLLLPQIGFLEPRIAQVQIVNKAPDFQISQHLINVRTNYHATQTSLRGGGVDHVPDLIRRIYQILPDAFDFFMLLSTNKVEVVPRLSGSNFNSGVHGTVRLDFTGANQAPFDTTALYGSSGRLLGINTLDTGSRGISASNATHELTHQWAARIDNSLGLSDGSHYKPASSAASLVGGSLWVDRGDGTYTKDCNEGRGGAHHAPPLDKYMMGLVDGIGVPPLRVHNESVSIPCGSIILPGDIVNEVSIEEIQALQGVRAPGPASSQKDFWIGFVAESDERLLTATEMTYYDIFAQHYRKILRPEAGDPYLGDGWVPVTRYFQEGTTWSTAVGGFAGTGGPAGRISTDTTHTPLLVTRAANGLLNLAWGESCLSSDSDYEIYEGVLGQFYSHVPVTCSTQGAVTRTVAPGDGDRYYLVVPRSADREGSYGEDGAGLERPQSSSPCLSQAVAVCQ